MDQAAGKQNAAEPQPEPKQDSGGLSHWVLWFFVFLLLYVLGIGPAARLHRSYPASRPLIETVYLPLVTLIKNSKPAETFFDWYVRVVWRVP